MIEGDSTLADPDLFLRTISSEFNERYPINAEWKGNVFHLYGGGKSEKVNRYLMEYLRETPNGTVMKFRQLVKKQFSELLEKEFL